MEFLLTFLEGVASFISPCILPMIPLYLSYLAGDGGERETAEALSATDGNSPDTAAVLTNEKDSPTEQALSAEAARKAKHRVFIRSLFFVAGFTLMFVVFGGLIGLVSGYISKHKTLINALAGGFVILFGLSYVGLFDLPFLKGVKKAYSVNGVFSAFLFGFVFAVGVGPCTGAFLGSALALASTSGTVIKGVLLLLFYSLGIGIPFIITAILTDKTKKLFGFIKRRFTVIKIVSGSLLIVMGVLMATGVMARLGALIG